MKSHHKTAFPVIVYAATIFYKKETTPCSRKVGLNLFIVLLEFQFSKLMSLEYFYCYLQNLKYCLPFKDLSYINVEPA